MAEQGSAPHDSNQALVLDAAVIGAGVAGLYQLYQLRQQGLAVRAFDSASNVGGTWYWNRYPGAKFDSESYIYQYLFDEDLYKDWSWSERFPGQPEIERWMNYIADRLELRPDIQFDTTIAAAHFDEARNRWLITTSDGQRIDAQFLVCCCGMLSAPLSEVFPGQDSFQGRLFHTARWPKEPIDFKDQRVGIVGIGATGIQVIQTIAPEVGHLKVFIRTPQYVNPMANPSYGADEIAAYKARFEELRDTLPYTFSGFEFDFDGVPWLSRTPAERRQILEDNWNYGSLKLWLATCPEMFSDPDISEEVSEFVRGKMRERLKDPALCELLIPTDYGFGTHRVPLESNYLEVYHRPNVEAVSVKDNPIKRVTPSGIELADGSHHDLDILILATGFDAGSGALTRIDIRGRGGRSLKAEWGEEIRTAYGLMVHGYPNLFTTGAPLAPSAALCNMTTCLQQQTEWISACIAHLRERGVGVIDASRELQDAWVEHHDEIANATLVTKTHSWYMGSNVDGKPRRLLSYIGGVGQYRQKCDELRVGGYRGFEMR
ncbi:MAG: NAD(P)/FAD-dependent oxidoreductase [Gammaproteobacteria bacterium]|nr:NAD(P)/FAD-dependent oxidoreductase [Gammaproteobacteria bacterium]